MLNTQRFRQHRPFLGRLKTSFTVIATIWLLSTSAWAEGIIPSRYEGKILHNGQLAISSRFRTELPTQLQDALKQGVPLDFVLSYRLESPTIAAYKFKINQLISNAHTVNYRLSFHPLTNRYRVSVGTFSTEYNTLNTALKAIGAIMNWSVLSTGTLNDATPHEVKAQIRLNLTTTRLPKPFQINALTSHNWDLDSGWRDLHIQ